MIDIARNDLGLMMEAGFILVGLQRFKEAREVFEGVAVMAPDSELPVVALGSVDFCEGKFREACRRYKRALKINGDSPFARAHLGEALFFLGKTTEATQELASVIQADRGGKAGAFAQSLLQAIRQGFTPTMLSGVDDLKQYRAQQQGREKGNA